MILQEEYKSFRTSQDYSTASITGLSITDNDLGIANIELLSESNEGVIEINVVMDINRFNKSRVFWNSETSEGSNIDVFQVVDGKEAQVINGGEFPTATNNMTFVIRLRRTEGVATPILHDFNLALWEEVTTFELQTATKPKNISADLIRLYNLEGKLIAFLENAKDIVTEDVLSAQELLSFSIPFTDPKRKMIQYDGEVVYKHRRYIITDIEDGTTDGGEYTFNITCELAYVELLNKTINEEFIIDLKTVREGLEQILEGTRWTVGRIDGESKETFSMVDQKQTALWYIKQWAAVVGMEIEWDSINRVVNFVHKKGNNRKVYFRYKKNLKSITRKIKPPVATVLYPYGKNGLSIQEINNGKPYLENYDWYIEQGLTLEKAKELYTKDYVWQDERYLLMYSLKRAGEEMLEQLSRPQISYECNVIDLSSVTGLREDSFFLGDDVNIFNDDLGIDAETRIVRIKKYHNEQWKNEIELGILQEGLEDAEQSRAITDQIQSAQPSVILATNETEPKGVTASPTIMLELRYSTFSSQHAQFGFSAVGEATHDSILTVRFLVGDSLSEQVIKQKIHVGWNTVALPLLFRAIPEGTNSVKVEMSVSEGLFNIPQHQLQAFMFANDLLGGGIGTESAPAPSFIQTINGVDVNHIIEAVVMYQRSEQKAETQIPISGNAMETVRNSNGKVVNNDIIGIASITLKKA